MLSTCERDRERLLPNADEAEFERERVRRDFVDFFLCERERDLVRDRVRSFFDRLKERDLDLYEY